MIDSLLDMLKKTLDFLGGLNILDFIFLGLFLILFIWMLVISKRVKRVIRDPLKKYDKEIKKKQGELDQEKEAIRAFAQKEIKKVEEVQAEQKAQFKKEIEELKGIKIEKEAELQAEAELRAEVELKAEAKEEAQAEKVVEVEKPAQVKQVAQEVQAEKEAQIEPKVQVEQAEEAVKEVQAEKEIPAEEEVKGEPALEPEKEAPIEKEIHAEKETPIEKEEPEEKIEVREEEKSKPEEEPKKAPKKAAQKEKPSKLTSEQYFILSAIGDEPDKTYQEDAMHKIFKMAFSDREKEDFDQDIKKLEKLNYIVLEKPSGYRVWLKITDKGLKHYRNTEEK